MCLRACVCPCACVDLFHAGSSVLGKFDLYKVNVWKCACVLNVVVHMALVGLKMCQQVCACVCEYLQLKAVVSNLNDDLWPVKKYITREKRPSGLTPGVWLQRGRGPFVKTLADTYTQWGIRIFILSYHTEMLIPLIPSFWILSRPMQTFSSRPQTILHFNPSCRSYDIKIHPTFNQASVRHSACTFRAEPLRLLAVKTLFQCCCSPLLCGTPWGHIDVPLWSIEDKENIVQTLNQHI